MAEISRAEVARERTQRMQAEARAAAAEEHARAVEYQVAVAEWLITLLRDELTGATSRKHWWWPHRPEPPQWEDAEERYRRSGRAAHRIY